MRDLILALACTTALTQSALALDVPRGAEFTLLYGNAEFAVLFWPEPGRLTISRGMNDLGGSAFPAEVASALASAALAQYGQSCSIAPPTLMGGAAGIHDVRYTC